MSRLLVCGLGQRHRGDDAVGLEAVAAWARAHPDLAEHPQVRVLLLESPGLALLEPLAQAEAALLVDAVRSGAPPGTLHHLSPAALAAFGAGSASAHGWGVAETLALAQALGRPLPVVLHILGVAVACLELGAPLSDPVAAALPRVGAAITRWVTEHLGAQDASSAAREREEAPYA